MSRWVVDREVYIVAALRKFFIRAVECFYLPTVSAFLERLVETKGGRFDALVDVRRRDARFVREDAELVVGRVRICLPFEFEILGAHFRSGLGIEQLEIALIEIRRRREQSLIGQNLVLVRAQSGDTRGGKYIGVGIEHAC